MQFLIFFSENSDNEQKEDWRQIISQLNRSSCSNEAYFESASKRQLKRTPNKSAKKKETAKDADPVSNFYLHFVNLLQFPIKIPNYIFLVLGGVSKTNKKSQTARSWRCEKT